ncbi:MAG: sugar ABC transporter ATP-binding protein [Treponema sp.]|jgi:ABC-type sugar transport system ATPase subunit|nr:sugar ABC transporter ATP-binding protein [Treponema sp.]
MAEYLLEMRNVIKKFSGVPALRNVNIQLKKGEILGICGENGAGKSTLMKILSGSYVYGEYDGEIIFDGEPVQITSVRVAEQLGIEMVYQEINMILDLDIAENLNIGNLPGKGVFVDYKTLYEETQKILKYIQIDASPKSKTRSLNSGQMQMVSLMRAYIKNPQILVLDEPTSALTDWEVDLLMSILEELRQKGVSCIYISHKLEEVYRICNRVLVLRDGETISCNDIGNISQDKLIEDMVGRKVENLYPKTTAVIGDEVLRVEHLSIQHPAIKGKNIISDIAFNLKKGEILGIGGLVGSGRSEILGALFGQIVRGVKKDVFFGGKKVSINKPRDAIDIGIGFVTEERKRNGIIWMLSIRDNMLVANLKDLPGKFFVDEKKEQAMAEKAFTRFRIKAPGIWTKVINLSGGNQQKVILAKWLLKNLKILFVDEPTKGIDVGSKAEIYKLLGELALDGMSIVMVSSDMPELISMSDRCIVISNGKITGEFNKGEITSESVMAAAIR